MSTPTRWRGASPISSCPTATTSTCRAASSGSCAALPSVFAGSGVGLMLIAEDGHSLRYVASSDDVARHLELAHEQSGEGPCVDAFVLDARVKTDDLLVEPRWPDLRVALRDQPIRAVLGLPTRLGTPVGTLNLYCERPRVWDESEITALEAYNHLLEARLAECTAGRQHDQIVDQLQVALDSRVTIERAIGLLMGRDGLDAADGLQRVAPDCAQLTAARERRRRGAARRPRRRDGAYEPTSTARAGRRRRPARAASIGLDLVDLRRSADRGRRPAARPARRRAAGRRRRRGSGTTATSARSALSGRMSCARSLSDDGRAGALRADREREQRPRAGRPRAAGAG